MEQIIPYLGFLLAAYAVIGNDVIQTLGTFIASNQRKNWFYLWLFAATILTFTLFYGWFTHSGDISYGRLDTIPLPAKIEWWYLLAPLALLIITRLGIPVSTTFMILSVFSTQQVIEKMLLKSVYGYGIAVIAAFGIYLLIAKKLESKDSIKKLNESNNERFWLLAQWGSTAFLWSQWLIQDFANIFVFLPRQLSILELCISLGVILVMMMLIFRSKGGKIQQIVNHKSNAQNIRSATLIDFSYGFLLFVYGNINPMPMSTTWAFIGILAGRELAINYRLHKKEMRKTYHLIVKDFAKVTLGLAISICIVFLIHWMKG